MIKVAEESMAPSCFGVHMARDHSNIPGQDHDFAVKKSDYGVNRTDNVGGQIPFILYKK